MRIEREGFVYAPYRLRVDRDLGARYLAAIGSDASGEVPLTYMIFLRGEAHGVDLFRDLDIPRRQALHGGQRYEWFAPLKWGDEVEVTATIRKITEKSGKGGTLWFADVDYEYRRPEGGELVLRETTRIIKRG